MSRTRTIPLLRSSENRLVGGFEILEKDHEILHQGIIKSAESANEFLKELRRDHDKARFAADGYTNVNADLLKKMLRHLDDEEDLIIPLILHRGEDKLGVA